MMHVRHSILPWVLLLGLLGLPACVKHASSPQPVEDRAPPGWIRIKPENSALYQGVGYTVITQDPQLDQRNAAVEAREDLLRDIQAGLKRRVVNGPAAEAMWPRVNWNDLQKSLETIAPRDYFPENVRRRVWAYVTLPSADLEQLIARRKASLEPRVRKHLAAADTARQNGKLIDALREQTAALYLVAGPEGFFMPGAQPGAYLRQEVEAGLTALVAQLEVRAVSAPDKIRAGGLQNSFIVLEATRRDTNQPAAGVPVALKFAKGAGDLAPTVTTGVDGKASAQLRSLDPRINPVQIEARLNLQALLAAARLPAIPDSALEPFELPHALFSIALDPPRLLLSQIERGGTGGGRLGARTHSLAETFRKQGLEVVDSNVTMLVNPEVFQKLEQGRDPGKVEGADMLGLVVVNLIRIRSEKGKYQDILYGEGDVSFRLYDIERRALLIDVKLPQEVSGFSQGDIERNFFLQSQDELREKVLDILAEDPFLQRGRGK